MTHRAKLRRLAFIDLPSWSRGSRPYSLDSVLGAGTRESLGSATLQSRCRPCRCQGNQMGLFSPSYRDSRSNNGAEIDVFWGWLRLKQGIWPMTPVIRSNLSPPGGGAAP